ncbi:TIGR02391 family protein [Pedobacter gandavensis]|uniref:TIGR02391 family protein n=1 Tax=Pedobacter gandavensis TaxID=2679963 RepID=UPI002479E27E|nr:TIGR02391 family protein [Pedobacter gandavensis]WGQ10720.1 TIGR02391 family protein [Pedobacter gandavensis]
MDNKIRKPLQPYHLEGICKIIAATEEGLKGSEIGKILRDCRINDHSPTITKWQRLYNAFIECQNKEQSSYKVIVFLCHAMQPSRYLKNSELYHSRLNDLNKQLSFIGIELTDTGKFRAVEKAATLTEAELRASHFKHKLEARNVHPEIFKYCKPELLTENYFHAVFESIKSIAERIRGMTYVHADGHDLINVVFAISAPLLQINRLQDINDRNEHNGFANIIRGLFSTIRNPTAHRPKFTFDINEDYALDVITMVSFVHKKLDNPIYP